MDDVIADYNRRTTWAEVLDGVFEPVEGAANRWHFIGADHDVSATTNAKGTDTLIVFSSTAAGHGWQVYDGLGKAPSYDRFSAHVLITTGRDDRAARVEVARRLRTDKRQPPPGVDPETGEIHDRDDSSPPDLPPTLPDAVWNARCRPQPPPRHGTCPALLGRHGSTRHSRSSYRADSAHRRGLPPLVGGPGSLNYFAAVIGRAGAGKSAGAATARDGLPLADRGLEVADDRPLGSGEGLAELYMGARTEDDPATGKPTKVRAQVRWNTYLYIDEGEALLDQTDRKGATISETLRRGWSGQTLGQSNASQDRTRIIPAGQYRLGMVIGFQPEKAGRLLADDVGGTPQRFVFASAIDTAIPDDPPPWPGPIEWHPPSPAELEAHRVTDGRGYTRHRLGIDPAIEPKYAPRRSHEHEARPCPNPWTPTPTFIDSRSPACSPSSTDGSTSPATTGTSPASSGPPRSVSAPGSPTRSPP